MCNVYDWRKGGKIQPVLMDETQIDALLIELREIAADTLHRSGHDHVIYCTKLFDDLGEIREVDLYNLPVNEKYFRKKVVTMKNVYVYAVHA